ncbi:tetratricopeptide repeat protein [uncultured Pseudodesulfovibrio sp.]|uniref:tetratricopeptide repeat protein n=1 Tax=uncultured Pseudodesulfovibrio sp. TaxID=2035858 RepID=UPI0029C93F6C|nr:tetratricopeptide repeat protein [uncultured Pseudodesulfovibrio sp.]
MKKKSHLIRLVVATFALLLTFGCVTQTDMDTLQIERQQDRGRIKQLEAELEESKQLLKEEIEKSQSPVRQRTADMWAEIQSLRADFAKLRGELETMEIRMDRQVGATNSTMTMSSLGDQLDEIEFVLENQLQVDLPKVREERAAALAASAAAAVAATPSGDANATIAATAAPLEQPKPQAKPADTDPAKALYDKAYALYKDGKFENARSYWAEFTDTFKGHPFSASAVFWQGQCYYKLKDYARAAILFEDVIEKYKKSSKYKSALLKAGYSWNYLGKPELAKMRMDEVIKKFPKSVEATQAKRFLKKMK